MSIVAGLIVLLVVLHHSFGQSNNTCLSNDGIQDIRLVDGTYGDFMGRIEIKYNGTWGTICDDFWSLNDVDVACRMLGYRGGGCAVSRARFGAGPLSSPIWMDNVFCNGEEDCLDDCSFIGLGDPVACSHSEDAGVICLSDDAGIAPPSDLTFINSTTNAITLQFSATPLSQLPEGATTLRYRLSYSETGDGDSFTRNSYFFPSTRQRNELQYTRTLTNLRRDTEYSVQVAVDYRYSSRICFSYISGSLSDKLIVRTNATSRPTNIPIRIVSPPNSPPFMGRVEVQYNGTWGTVCDDFFSTTDANVFCRGLGYERSLCNPFFPISGPGTGPIWLDNLNCPSSAEILEDCSHPGWGVHNCRHSDDAEVVCRPDESYLGGVSRPTVTEVRSTSADITWQPFTFPNDGGIYSYQVRYRPVGRSFSSSRTVADRTTELTLTNLIVGETYIVTVRAQARVRACFFSNIQGNESEAANFTTIFAPPEGPPTDFHIIVLNSTAVEVQWEAPLRTLQNGDILGYVVVVLFPDGSTEEHDFHFNETDFDVAIIINNLRPSTMYSFSVLAYNFGGRGPRSIFLRDTTYAIGDAPIITRFGLNGDGLDRVIRFTFQRNLLIHCGTAQNNIQIDWFSPEGVKVGINDRNLREGHYNNGTTVLQIAASRRLNSCDGGVYTCVANDTTSGTVQSRKFFLIISSAPDRLNRPFPLEVKSNSIQIGWEPLTCKGGHVIVEYNIQFYEVVTPSFNRIIQTVPHIDVSLTNYTIKNLRSSTSYSFQIQAVNSNLRGGSFSFTRTILTKPAAPSPPRDVSVRIIGLFIIEVSWRLPSAPNGEVVRYTVYLTPVTSSRGDPTARNKRQAVQSPDIIIMTFSGSETSGNITVPSTGIAYDVQVTASVQVGNEINEGQPSPMNEIFVPEPVIPVPQDVRQVKSTNSTITLQWDLPPPPFVQVQDFLVSYNSSIKWRTPMGRNIQFLESGSVNIPSTMTEALISPLTPGTEYNFKIVANSGEKFGQEAFATANTTGRVTDKGRVAFLQLRFGPVDKCSSFQVGNVKARLDMVESAIITEVNKLCSPSCGLTPRNLQNGSFSCDNGLIEQVVYRGRILGNNNNNAGDLVSLIQSWVDSDLAVIVAGFFRFKLDSTCSSTLDSLDSPDCKITMPLPPTQLPSQSPAPVVSVSTSNVSTGEIILLVVCLVIIFILVGVVVLLSVLCLRKQKSWTNGTRLPGAVRFKNPKEEDKEPFANMGPSDQNTIVFDSDNDSEKPPIM